jgi:beta-glucosidase/6-phospho-beta-glucosidase/beta-galactosidase
MSKLGTNAYRFGIEWSRLQSEAFGPLNQKELDRYCDLLDKLKAAGITPMVVLHHFSNPPWINKAGGWTNHSTIAAFVDYVSQTRTVLKDRVYLWNTFNEPDTYACVAYLLGGFPPQRKWRLGQFRRVIDHMARAHVQASRIIRRTGLERSAGRKWALPRTGRFFHAYKRYSLWDLSTAFGCHYTFNKFVLDAFLGATGGATPPRLSA